MSVIESLEWASCDTELFHHLNTTWRSVPSHGPPVTRTSLFLAARCWVELGFKPGAARLPGAVGRDETATLPCFSYFHGFLFLIRLVDLTGLLQMCLLFAYIQPSEKQKVPFVRACGPHQLDK